MGISYVVNKAKIKCSKGGGISTLKKSPENDNLEIRGKVMLTIGDNKPGKNFEPFSSCKSEKNPEAGKSKENTESKDNKNQTVQCKPVICNKWMHGEKDVYLNGELALNSGCELACLYGGIIKIVDDGQ